MRRACARSESATSPAISTKWPRFWHDLELVPAPVALGGEIGAVVLALAGAQRHPLGHLDPFGGERLDLAGIVGEQADAGLAEPLEHARGDAEIALVVVEAEP